MRLPTEADQGAQCACLFKERAGGIHAPGHEVRAHGLPARQGRQRRLLLHAPTAAAIKPQGRFIDTYFLPPFISLNGAGGRLRIQYVVGSCHSKAHMKYLKLALASQDLAGNGWTLEISNQELQVSSREQTTVNPGVRPWHATRAAPLHLCREQRLLACQKQQAQGQRNLRFFRGVKGVGGQEFPHLQPATSAESGVLPAAESKTDSVCA